jgi:DNA-binding NarL/FixJ family response regulator
VKKNNLVVNTGGMKAAQVAMAKRKKSTDETFRLKPLERVSIVANLFRPGVGFFVEKIIKSSSYPVVDTVVIDSDEIASSMQNFRPNAVIVDVDSLLYADSLSIAIAIREIDSEQVIIFMSERTNPILVNEGMVAALWNRAYWINQPSRNPAMVVPEIVRAFNSPQRAKTSMLKNAIKDSTQFGLLSPQQHRVMRLMAMGGSNSAIAQECNLTVKAVERTIASASKLLEVDSASEDTNHRVKAAMRYATLMLFADSVQPFLG